MATLIRSSGEKTTVTPQNQRSFSLKEMQMLVNGSIEIVPLHDGSLLVCNETFKIDGLPFNRVATQYAHERGLRLDDWLAGNIVIASDTEIE